jgi:hypothetical protein
MKNNALWEQLQLNQRCGYYSIVQKNDGRVSIVSTKKDDCCLRFSGFFDDLEEAKMYIGTSTISKHDIEVLELQEKEGEKIIGTLLPQECMGNELLPVGTKVVIHKPESAVYHMKVGTIEEVDDSDRLYEVVYDNTNFSGSLDWYTPDLVKPYYPQASEQDDKMEEGELIGSIKINQTLSKDDALIITNTFQYDDNGNEVSKSIGYEIKKEEPKPECDHIVGWHTITEYGNDDDDMPFEDLYFVKSKELPVPATLQPLTYFKYCHECGEKLNLKKDE